jgi:TolB-like protein/Tfp pilus assembly protein PilF
MRLFAELRRRNVFRVGAAYAVVAWILLQAADILLGNFGAPDWVFRSFTVLVALGFPLAMFLSWAYELTPEGVKRTAEVPVVDSITGSTGRKLDFIIIGVLSIAVVWFAWDRWFGGAPDPMPATAEASIAVLPFVNMSPDPEQAYFSDGLSEEILNLLAQVDDLRVIGRTSSFAFRDRDEDLRAIGAALGVSHLLEGSVRKAGEQLRITAQLVRAEDGTNLWSQAFNRRLENVFAVQLEIAEAIGEALQVSLTGAGDARPAASPTESIPAYERYLQARRLIQGRSVEGLEAAGRLLGEAVQLDPGYAPAWAGTALVQLLLADTPGTYGDIPVADAVAAAGEALERAIALDPRLAEAHAVRGLMHITTRDFRAADEALVRALEINPSLTDALNWRANMLTTAGQLEQGIQVREQLAMVDPLHVVNLGNHVQALMWAGRNEEAIELAKRIQRGFPDHPFGYMRRAEVLAYTGQLAAAHAPAMQAAARYPGSTSIHLVLDTLQLALGHMEGILSRELSYFHDLASFLAGREEEAISRSRQRARAAPDHMLAVINHLHLLALAGRHEEVLDELDRYWGSVEQLVTAAAYDGMTNELTPVAVAQKALGHDAELARTLERWGARITFLRDQGYRVSRLSYIEAGFQALSGNREAALEALGRAIDEGYRVPWLAREAAFSALRDDPAFQAEVERMVRLVNIEREQLGLERLADAGL